MKFSDLLGRAALVWLFWIAFFSLLCGVPLPAAVLLGADAVAMTVGLTPPQKDSSPSPHGGGFTPRPRNGWIP